MARQTGVLQLEGNLGDLCFYKTKHGFFVRSKGSISKARIKSDPAFQRVRENNSIFARAAHAVKVFRAAFRPLLNRSGDSGLTGRLIRTMMHVLQADEVNPRNKPTVKDGQPSLLEGFEFNLAAPLSKKLNAPFTPSIQRARGSMVVRIPSFSPAHMISAPAGATHFRLFSGGAAIDFESSTYKLETAETKSLPISEETTPPFRLTQKVSPGTKEPLFLLLGIQFVNIVNGKQMPVADGRYDAMAVVKVSDR